MKVRDYSIEINTIVINCVFRSVIITESDYERKKRDDFAVIYYFFILLIDLREKYSSA